MIGDTVAVGVLSFRVLGHPEYSEAHPGEPCDDGDVCERCAIAERLDTRERVLLWLCGGINWSISRHDPRYARHRMEAAI